MKRITLPPFRFPPPFLSNSNYVNWSNGTLFHSSLLMSPSPSLHSIILLLFLLLHLIFIFSPHLSIALSLIIMNFLLPTPIMRHCRYGLNIQLGNPPLNQSTPWRVSPSSFIQSPSRRSSSLIASGPRRRSSTSPCFFP